MLTRSRCSPISELSNFLLICELLYLTLPSDTDWGVYDLSVQSMDFEGVPTTGLCTANDGTLCFGPGFPDVEGRLGDGIHGPQTLNVTAVQAWNQTVSITISSFSSPIVGINLYFYNIPSRGIGLPYDIIINSAGLQFALEGNQDLSQDDNQLRNITLIPQSLTSTAVTITFTFSERDRIDWLLLTELEVCTDSTGALIIFPLLYIK